MIERGVPWGEPVDATGARLVRGNDADLAAALAESDAGTLLRFAPERPTDFARALGAGRAPHERASDSEAATALEVDLLRVDTREPAVNAVVVGPVPGRLTAHHRSFEVEIELDGRPIGPFRAQCVVVANGQFVAGADVVPRGHPGDGWCEVQVYDVPRAQRRELRRRLPGGGHLPHPGIVQRRARAVSLTTSRPVPVVIDGRPAGRRSALSVTIERPAARLVV